MNGSFINKLQQIKSKYANPTQASTQAKSLDLLSSGIYTEEERFVFELLQNAVDAYNGSTCLNVKIILLDNYLVVMHNGDKFSERDIEGLCDVGYGNKMADVKKIGYKGIGFKSVFMHSQFVTVQSGEYCFKFEKSQWDNYWDPDWGAKDNSRKYSMPWQIIPIETTVPVDVAIDGFNVITYIKTGKSIFLREKIQKLFSSSSFLLFLRHTHINIDFIYKNKLLINIKKRTYNGVVELLTNGKLDSRWLVYCNPEVTIDDEIHDVIATDGITPIKLQEAKTFDISFALLLDNKGRIVPLENSCAYTYLPTSITFGFPFLVNANFITDAGRQHLVNDSEWNKMIVKEIPMEFLKWMAMISLNIPSYYKALPTLNIGAEGLCTIYNSSILNALNEIAFIPSAKGGLLKASDAIMDRIGISKIIGMESLLEHINRQYQKSFTEYSFINNGGITILREYGVFDFGVDKLKLLFGDESTLKDISVSKDIDLIKFLYDFGNHSEKEEHLVKEIIADLPFIYSEDKQLCKPIELFFPSDFKADNSITNDVSIIHHKIYTALSNNLLLMEWVKNVGVCEMNEINIIANHICKNGYITNNNALDVGKYLFSVWEKDDFTLEIPSSILSNLKFITNKGNLKNVDELYQSSKYFPALDLQTVCDADIFISDDYCDSTNESTRRKWHNFLRDMNVCDDIQLRELKFKRDTDIYNLLKSYVAFAESHEYNHSLWTGGDYYMSFMYINIKYVPYLSVQHSDFDLSKLIWSYILSQPIELDRSNDYIYGSTGGGYYKRGYLCDKSPEHDYLGMNFLTWVIKNHQTFPASNGEMLMANDLYKNTPLFKELFGEYIPYLDVDCEIDNSWNELLPFKTDPSLEDYLSLLSKISNDKSKADENKQRISKIYQYIVESFNIESEKNKKLIKEWAETGKILSRDGVFVTPSELRHISLDGFSDKQRVYIGQVESRNKVLDLFKIMGVKIITENSVKYEIQNQEERDEIKRCLTAKAKVLALLKAGEKPTKEDYDKELSSVNTQLNDTHFYHCTSIKLSYGNDNDTIEKVTFGNNSNFYYTGEVRIAKIDPLLTPLCNYLKLKGKERELIVTMFEDMSAIREYLQEKEYQVSFLEDVKDDSSHVFTASLNYSRNEEQRRRDAITGHLGEIIVYEKLKEMGYTPICLSLSDENDYEDIVEYKGKKYYCKSNYGRYDIEFVTETGGKMLVEVKSTTMDKKSQENMPISYREISLVEEYSNNEEISYIIVRVFNVNSSNPDIYMFKGQTI